MDSVLYAEIEKVMMSLSSDLFPHLFIFTNEWNSMNALPRGEVVQKCTGTGQCLFVSCCTFLLSWTSGQEEVFSVLPQAASVINTFLFVMFLQLKPDPHTY